MTCHRAPAPDFGAPLALASPLARLRRGDDELVLVPGRRGAPLYLRTAPAVLEGLLREAVAAPSLGALLDRRPRDAELLRMLVDHGVLEPAGAAAETPAPDAAPPGCDAGGCDGASLYLLLSQRCNCACTYCLAGERTYGGDKPAAMSDEIARAAIERTLEGLAPGGRLDLVFFGGEPLLNWPLARRLLAWIEEELAPRYPGRTVAPHATTNLVLLPDDLVEVARRHRMTFLVDVDGPPDLHDRQRPLRGGGPSHATIARNLGVLRAAGLPVGLRATVTAANVERMVEIARHHRELGGDSSAFVPVNPIDSDERILPRALLPDPRRFAAGLRAVLADAAFPPERLYPFNEFLPRLRAGRRMGLACGAPRGRTPVVDSAGDIFPCIYWVGIARLAAGNVRDGPVLAPRPVHAALAQQLHVDHLERCRGCDWRYVCGGGCPVQRVTLAAHPDATAAELEYAHDIACETASAVISELLWRDVDRGRAAAG